MLFICVYAQDTAFQVNLGPTTVNAKHHKIHQLPNNMCSYLDWTDISEL